MNIRLKKFFSAFSILSMLCMSTSSIAYAQSLNKSSVNYNCKQNKQVFVYNEYEYLKSLENQSISELKSRGFDNSEIEIIHNVDQKYDQHIKTLKNLDKSDLKNYGYSNDQVNAIKSYQGDISKLSRLGASCTVNSNKKCFYYSNNRTHAEIKYSFQWSGAPMVKNTDILAIGWSEGFYVEDNTYLTVTYKGRRNSKFTKKYSPNIKGTRNCGLDFKFDTSIGRMHINHGEGIIYLNKIDNIPEFSTRISYGHRTITGQPSASIGIGFPSISITFNMGTSEMSFSSKYWPR